MCGIAGIVVRGQGNEQQVRVQEMINALRHRGPDESGMYADADVCLGHARLSIIDLKTGKQPIHNEDKTLWITYNGEVFNYPDLRRDLLAKGHLFTTTSDTEVILHGYEEFGVHILDHLNGQYAFAIWDCRKKELFLARDRLGIRPLFYYHDQQHLIFASEIKAILTDPQIPVELDPFALSQVFTFWTTLYPRTIFKNILELPPAHYLLLKSDTIKIEQYWKLSFPAIDEYEHHSFDYWAEQLRELLIDAATIRLRADVPVGAYLSGGLDSSVITAIITNYTKNPMKTFSISFEDAEFDESKYQQMASAHLQTQHRVQSISNRAVAGNFARTIWHVEKPILRTAPVPLLLLSRLVRENNFKVVLTGEGADEILGGYNIFKEALVRRFWAKNPSSKLRPLLLQKLYPYLKMSSPQLRHFNEQFFAYQLTQTDHPAYSHLVRWRNYDTFFHLFSDEIKDQLKSYQPIDDLCQMLPPEMNRWAPLSRAQYLEITLFMSGYLLSSQGDRVAMAHSVEGRFPFLDYRLVELCSKIPPTFKLHFLNEKYILKKTMGHLLPPPIMQRPKQPYRAPVARCFFTADQENDVYQLLHSSDLGKYFSHTTTSKLISKWKNSQGILSSERDNMAFLGILSTLLVDRLFITKNMNIES